MKAPVRYTVTSHCLARGALTLTPALARALEGTPPVVRLGKESYPLEVDRERGLVLGLREVYEALRVGTNDKLVLYPTPEGLEVEVAPRPKPARPREEAKREEAKQEEAPKTPPRPKKVVRLGPGGWEEVVQEAPPSRKEEPPAPPSLPERVLSLLEGLGFVRAGPWGEGELFASGDGAFLLFARPPKEPPPLPFLVAGDGTFLRGLELLARSPWGKAAILEFARLGKPLTEELARREVEERARLLEARAPLSALLLLLARRGRPVREKEVLEEAGEEALKLLPHLLALPLGLVARRGESWSVPQRFREAAEEASRYFEALAAHPALGWKKEEAWREKPPAH